jgi:alpha-galactosidase
MAAWMLTGVVFAMTAPAALAGGAAPISVTPKRSLPAAVPYMGWNTYYGVGGAFDEQTIVAVANSLLRTGLAKAGYRIVWLDFGWASGKRDAAGQLIVSSKQWPQGLQWLTAWLHQRGLLAGIYTDAGASGCSHKGAGSLHHYQQDADSFAAWGFDAVKVDFCGAGQEGLSPQPLYRQFAEALAHNSSDRRLLLNVCNFWTPGQIDGKRPSYANSSYGNYRWAPALAQSWRTDTDIGYVGKIAFKDVLRNLDADAAHPKAARPGHWNDPDYLGPQLGMNATQAQTQLSMWAIVAAPLILGSDPRRLSAATIAMLTNPRVIAIDRDRLGVEGTAVATHGSAQVWVKRLAGGQRAVALLNRGATTLKITTSAAQAGMPKAASYQLLNVWSGKGSTSGGTIRASVPADGVALYRLTAL